VGIVLAGRPNTGALRAVAPECAWEALIPVGGSPMAALVAEALGAVAGVRRVVVAGPPDLADAGLTVAPPGTTAVESLRSAWGVARAAGVEDEVLVASGDVPLLRAETVASLVAASRDRRLHLGYPVVRRETCERRFPGVRRTYVRLRDGAFTGGNCVYLRAEALPACLSLLERVYRDRKRPLRLAGLLGVRVLLALAVGRASLAGVEEAASRLLGHPAGAWICSDAGIGVDVDRPSDLALCRAALAAAASVGQTGDAGEEGGS
jgi:hypothetical protein